MTDHRPLILTARMASEAQLLFQRLRDRHFPPERNIVPAHLTLFHHLPGGEEAMIVERLKAIARGQEPIPVEVAGLRSLGQGVAFDLRSEALADVRAELAESWHGLLVPQDRQGWRAHVTVQNKVEPAVAKATLAELFEGFRPWRFAVTGVQLWRYLGGPWDAVREVGFRG